MCIVQCAVCSVHCAAAVHCAARSVRCAMCMGLFSAGNQKLGCTNTYCHDVGGGLQSSVALLTARLSCARVTDHWRGEAGGTAAFPRRINCDGCHLLCKLQQLRLAVLGPSCAFPETRAAPAHSPRLVPPSSTARRESPQRVCQTRKWNASTPLHPSCSAGTPTRRHASSSTNTPAAAR